MRAPLLAIVTVSALLGCARTGLEDAAAASPQSSGMVVRVTLFVNAYENDWAAATETLVVDVVDSNDESLSDASVVGGPAGDPLVVPYRATTSRYELERIGYVQAYEVSVERGTERIAGTFTGPPPYQISIDPDPVYAGAPATVHWTPNDEPEITAHVQVFPPGTAFDVDAPELGALDLPASAFPSPGEYEILVSRTRAKATSLGAASSYATVAAFDYRTIYAQ